MMRARFLALSLVGSLLGQAALSQRKPEKKKSVPAEIPSDSGTENINCDQVLEDFSKDESLSFPERWTSHSKSDLKRAQRDRIYEIVKAPDGNFLKAVSKGDGVILHLNLDRWNLQDHPILRWKWRVHQLPSQASEDKSSTNDVAASVYVIWKSSFMMRVKSIKMTWSSTLEPGTHISKRLGYDHVYVLRKGDELKDRWVTEAVNVQELAKRYYPTEKDPPIAIAILSDADNTKSSSSADYAGFELCRGRGIAAVDRRRPALK